MTIYVVQGILKEEIEFRTEMLKAFIFREKAEKFCEEQVNKKDNPYKEVYWEQTELE